MRLFAVTADHKVKGSLRLAGVSLAALSFTGAAHCGPKEDAQELLAMWGPKSVRVDDGVMTIALPQSQVTEEIYMAVMTAGLCPGILLDKPLESVREIQVLNKFRTQGYVYEKGLEDCEKINSRPSGDDHTLLDILSATHMF